MRPGTLLPGKPLGYGVAGSPWPGLFSASGTQIPIDSGMPAIVAVVLGMRTAVFGGVLRDVVCNQIPRAFSDHRVHAICSFVGGWVLVAAHAAALPAWIALVTAAGDSVGDLCAVQRASG